MVLKICPICGKEFNVIPAKCKEGVINCCSKSCCTKLKWQDEKYREYQINKIKESHRNKKTELKRIQAIKASWTKEKREKQSNSMKNNWKNENYYKEHKQINKECANRQETRRKKSELTTNQWKNEEFKEQQRQERIKRWQNKEYKQKLSKKLSSKEVLDKKLATLHKNNSFRKSKSEEAIYELLKSKYKNTKYQYKSTVYPFYCDFYIPEKDLYIEFNGYWSHGKHKYIGNEEDLRVLEEWKEKAKTSEHYRNAIYVWTELDPRKRRTAEQNQVKLLEFYSISDFLKWFNVGLD